MRLTRLCGIFPLSGRTSSHSITKTHPTDPFAASFHPQSVRPVRISPKSTQLTLAPPSACAYSHSITEIHPPDPLTASLCPQHVCPLILSSKCTLLTLLGPHLQHVRRLILSPKCTCRLFCDLGPPSDCTLSHPITEMHSTDPLVASSSECMSSHPFIEMHLTNPLAASPSGCTSSHPITDSAQLTFLWPYPQFVRLLVLSLKPLPTLLRPHP